LGRKEKWKYFRVIYGRYGKANRKTKPEMLKIETTFVLLFPNSGTSAPGTVREEVRQV